jgi:hypothetical protein
MRRCKGFKSKTRTKYIVCFLYYKYNNKNEQKLTKKKRRLFLVVQRIS